MTTDLRCSFCNKRKSEVRHLVFGENGNAICDECVQLCVDILAVEGTEIRPSSGALAAIRARGE